MSKKYFNRYVWLVDLINRHGYITMADINRSWRNSSLNDTGENIPERTFFNHKDAILDTFGLEIKYDRMMGYYIRDSGIISDSGVRNWLLQSLSLNNILNECTDMRDRILFEQIPSSQKFLTELISAMRDCKVISMTYQSFRRNEPSTFNACPYCLKIFKQRWYMVAPSEAYFEPRIYALDRMIDMEELDDTFELPQDFNAEDFFHDCFGIIKGDSDEVEDIKIRVDSDQVKYYRSLPLHHSQAEIQTENEYSIFQFHLVPTFDFKQEILSKGVSVEVLEPLWFRDWIADTASRMSSRYHLK